MILIILPVQVGSRSRRPLDHDGVLTLVHSTLDCLSSFNSKSEVSTTGQPSSPRSLYDTWQ